MWTLIGILCVTVGAWLVYTVLAKKFPQLKLIDLSTLAKERHAQVKARIIHSRFERSLGQVKTKTAGAFGRLQSAVRKSYERAYGSLKNMESGVERQDAAKTPEASTHRLAKLLREAEGFVSEGRWEEAERLLIEALKLDDKRLEPYRGLVRVYQGQRLADQAIETMTYLVHLGGDDADRAELGRMFLERGDVSRAYEQFRKIVQSQPYNPKYLDYFLETSILIGDAEAAEEALNGLEAANPANSKLSEFRRRIDEVRAAASEQA